MIGRCINDINRQKFNQGKIKANELVTFDCGLMEGKEIEKSEIDMPQKDKQLLAVIVRPEIEPNYILAQGQQFEFCNTIRSIYSRETGYYFIGIA